jgi:peptidoglycan hydrolase-like protein with peptidoglycan-binding domain
MTRPPAGLTCICLGAAALSLACTQTDAAGASGPVVPTATAAVTRTDVASTQTVQGTIAYSGTFTLFSPGGAPTPAAGTAPPLAGGATYTWLPQVGSVVQRGQRLYEVSGRPVPAFYGERPAWRRLAAGVSGPDVRQLEDNLLALGFARTGTLAEDGNFGAADAAAVRSWQASLGVEQTGAVELGALVFVPGTVRVAALHAAAGAPLQPGSPVLDVSSTQKVVSVQLDTLHEQFVSLGDQVQVTLPDGQTTTAGAVTSMGSAAGTPGGQEAQTSQGAPPLRPAVPVEIAVADQGALARYDQAPVRVSITDAVHRGVLAVPVTALLAQGDGGYAVRVVRGSGGSLLPVQVGLFGDDGLVEVTGRGLEAGLRVQVPQA